MKTMKRTKILMAATLGAVVSLAAVAADNGEEIVAKARATDLTVVEGDEFVSAKEQVERNLEKLGLSQEYNPEKKSMIKIGVAYKQIKDPANDKKFSALRTLKYMEAYLNAKAEIIRAIEQDMSAMDRAETFGEFIDGESARDVFAAKQGKFAEKVAAFVARIPAENEKVVKALSVPVDSSFGAALDDALAVIDEAQAAATPDVKKVANAVSQDMKDAGVSGSETVKAVGEEADKQIPKVDVTGNALKRELQALKTEFDALAAEDKKLSETPSAVQESVTKTMARMPILGATVLIQTESWNKETGEYQVAVACVWSAALEENAKQLAMGDFTPVAKKGPCSVRDWVKKQDLSRMLGSRQFIDDKGRRIIIGIGAREEPKSVSQKKAVERQVAMEASRNVAFAMMGDVQAATEAKSMSKEMGDESTTAESIADKLSQKLDSNFKGLGKLMDKEVKSPITGKRMMVSVYYLDPSLAKDSAGILKKAYENMMLVTRATQRAHGRHAGFEQALEDTRKSTEEFDKAKAGATKEVKEAVETAERQNSVNGTGAQGAAQSNKGENKGGTFTGDADVNTDF